MLIGSADVGRHDLQNDAVWSVLSAKRVRFARRHLELRVFDRFHLDLTRSHIGDSPICWHVISPFSYFFYFGNLEGGSARCGNGMVLLAGSAADTDGAYDLAVLLQRNAAGK